MIHKHGSNRRDDDREFPALLVIIGLFLVAIVWVGVFRPNLLDNLPFQSTTAQPRQAPVAATIQENTPSHPQPAPSPAEEPSREVTSALSEAVDAGGKQGGIDPARTKAGTSRVADGRFVPTRMAVIGQLSVGPKSKSSLEVSIMASAGPPELADGLLGMNFLRDYRYQIDMADQKIHWN